LDLHELDSEWRTFLKTVQVTPESRIAGVESFQIQLSQAYTKRTCPKLGSYLSSAKPLEALAWEQWRWGNYDAALSGYVQLYDTTHELRFRILQAQMMRELGRLPEAVHVLDETLNDEATPAGQRVLCAREERTCLMKLQQWDKMDALLAAWSSFSPQIDRESQAIHAALRNPAQRDAVAQALTTRDNYLSRRAMEKLAEQFPRDEAIQYLYLAKAFAYFTPAWGKAGLDPDERGRLDELLALINTNPGIADRLCPNLLAFAARAVESADFDFALRLANTLKTHSDTALNRYLADTLLDRIAFERAYYASHETRTAVAPAPCEACATAVAQNHSTATEPMP
jgi:hypothetical protein